MRSPIFPRNLSFPLFVLLFSILAGCNMPDTLSSGTPAAGETEVYQTVEARLTGSAVVTPTLTTTPNPTESGSPSPAPTAGQQETTLPTQAPTATEICDRAGAGNPIYLTIPDDSPIQPGQAFTKKWALENLGSCTWTREYAVHFFSGLPMGAPENMPLGGDVAPGETVEIAIDMVAPMTPGTYQGNWKLRNASNTFFGIGPSGAAPFWVRIVVMPPFTSTPLAATLTPTPSLTPTVTPVPQASGPVVLKPADRLDLDTNRVNPEGGVDLTYESNQNGEHLLVPAGNAQIGIYSSNAPSMADCQAAEMTTTNVKVENLTGVYLCYRTGQGLPGRALVTGLNVDDFSLSLNILTWKLP